MKRFFFPILSAVMFSGFLAVAQTPPPSPQELQEKVERLSGDVERLTQDNLSLKNKITALSEEMAKMREDLVKANANSGVQDEMRRLSEKIQTVDEARVKGNRDISEQIQKLGENLEKMIRTETKRTPRISHTEESKDNTPEPGPQKGYEYVIQSGDTLSTVLQAYNKEFKSKGMKTVSMQQVIDANPKVNWNALQVGKKIFIPMPK